MFHDELFQTKCFTEENLHVLNSYQAVQLPFKNEKRVELKFPQEVTFEPLPGLFSSASMYQTYCEKYPKNTPAMYQIKL